MEKQEKFKICITMAGAVSAGAYTAGVLDYLFETLQLWQDAKDKNLKLGAHHPEYDNSVPMHDVEIDIVSGTSAGGMTAAILILSLLSNKLSPVQRKNIKTDSVSGNLLYDIWVNMIDDGENMTFRQLFDCADLSDNSEQVESLLNSNVIEQLAQKAFNNQFSHSFPAYVSKDLDLILTVTSLEGLSFKLNFTGNTSSNGVGITTHDGFLRYRFNPDVDTSSNESFEQLFYNIDTKNAKDLETLKKASMSTGAFPLGFKPHKNLVSKKYISAFPRFIFRDNSAVVEPLGLEEIDRFEFTAIDGGVVNNEPYGLTKTIFEQKYSGKGILDNKNYAVLMIDPFPAINQKQSKYAALKDTGVVSVGLNIIKALRNQALFNQNGISDALNEQNQEHFLIAPTRAEGNMHNKVWNALACGALGGFSGFMSKEFRAHDFELGRQNCQTALRYYFALDEEKAKNTFGECAPEAFDRFHFEKRTVNSALYPIIPDLKVKRAVNNQYDYEQYGEEAELGFDKNGKVILSAFPSISADRFKDYKNVYQKLTRPRIAKIVRRISGKWWLPFFIKKRIDRFVWSTIENELRAHELIK